PLDPNDPSRLGWVYGQPVTASRRVGAVSAVLLFALVAAGSSIGSEGALFKPSPYDKAISEPTEIVPPLNGDPPMATKLDHWANWGSARTSSTGRVFYNPCRPDCAGGYRGVRGRAVLSRVRECRGAPRYTAVRFIYTHQARYDATFRYECSG